MTKKRPSTRPDLPAVKKKRASGEVETKRPPPPGSRSKRPRAVHEELEVDFSKDPRRERS